MKRRKFFIESPLVCVECKRKPYQLVSFEALNPDTSSSHVSLRVMLSEREIVFAGLHLHTWRSCYGNYDAFNQYVYKQREGNPTLLLWVRVDQGLIATNM